MPLSLNTRSRSPVSSKALRCTHMASCRLSKASSILSPQLAVPNSVQNETNWSPSSPHDRGQYNDALGLGISGLVESRRHDTPLLKEGVSSSKGVPFSRQMLSWAFQACQANGGRELTFRSASNAV